MHGFIIIREPRSGCGRVRFKTVSIHPIVSSFAAVINSRQSVCNLLSIPYISNWNTCILDFFWLIDFLPFISRKFYETIILSCNFTTSEGKKNFDETLYSIYNLGNSCLLRFTYTYLPFDFSDACLLGHPSYFDKSFLVIFQPYL